MTDAIRAAYSSFKHVPTRSVLQLVLEVPIEQAEAALALLGIPQPGEPTWCAIARLNDSAASPHEETQAPPIEPRHPEAGSGAAGRPALIEGERLVQMAGILCADERFQYWLAPFLKSQGIGWHITGSWEKDVAENLRRYLSIASRRELATNPDAQRKFEALVDRYKTDTGQSTWRKPT